MAEDLDALVNESGSFTRWVDAVAVQRQPGDHMGRPKQLPIAGNSALMPEPYLSSTAAACPSPWMIYIFVDWKERT